MTVGPGTTSSTTVPTMRYLDAPRAIEWLCRAFGFEKRLVVPGDGDTIAHAQLTFGNGMVMLGSARGSELEALQKRLPREDVATESVYIIVDDVDAHHGRAVREGAEVVDEPADQDHGGRFYSCKDPEGRVWSFGSYDPWASADS